MSKHNETPFSGLYLGEYERPLDAQHRVALPSEWRNDGGNDLVAIPAKNNAIVLLPLDMFLDFVNKAKSQAIANSSMQLAFAYLGANSRQVRCDKQGRAALDAKVLARIGVTNTVKLIGAVNHIRVCSPGNWSNLEDSANLDFYLDEVQKVGENSGDMVGLLKGILGK